MKYLCLAAVLALSACTGKPSFQDASLSERQLNLETYFAGDLRAYGQFQDVLGTVRRQFVVDIDGTWDGEILRLVEDFVYEDGSTEQRIWTLRKTGPMTADQTWEGTAPGVIGVATGREEGDRFNWRYTIDLPVGEGETTRVTFDDWMWLQEDGRLLNRAYMKRFGLDVGDVIITFEKR
ncbi:uncharacterized protein DUF3833 [Litoreibacter ponti]|uniref:Uncharacterized protein DUF3833 n=1 Tax=Litoreibacter ponti TaxID=1510457 RepID=A0A2T6BEQ0_9RHOB|nr:DUF3833 domain-containing protein [Litoreibacter ponti]PTX54540.1 uncharacterized protein DUF3833 [Litoreibacter ponti]